MLGTVILALPAGALAGAGAAVAATRLLPAGPGGRAAAARFGVAVGVPLALAAALLLPPALWPAAALLAAGLVALAWLDLAARIVHAGLVLPLAAAGLLHALAGPGDGAWHAVAGMAAGYVLLRLAESLFRRLRGHEGLGRGDSWVLGAIGAWVGLEGIGPVLALGALLALLGAVLAARGIPDGAQALPFVPALALAGWAVWLGGAA